MNVNSRRQLFTGRDLMQQLASLGIGSGQLVMLHASVNAVGKVMGGPNEIIQALLNLLEPDGTLMMYAGWEDIPDFVLDLPPDERQRYYDEHPAFDPAIARAFRENSVLAEFLRSWPGARRSANPEASIVAVGRQADALTRDHSLNYGYGDASPLAKLVAADGVVLMLGAPLDSITLLHHAENRAKLRHKNKVHYQCPILQDGARIWVDIEDYDTGDPHADYTLQDIAEAYLKEGVATTGKVGNADCYCFPAPALLNFAVNWLEARFGE